MSLRVSGLVLCVFALAWPAPSAARGSRCGDGRRDPGERCDGRDLGGLSCSDLGWAKGALRCTDDCTFDTAWCSSDVREPVCGDGVVHLFEECDVGADSACPGACSAHCACPSLPPGQLELHMIDVGQGDGLLLISPDGFTMLIDAGIDSAGPRVAEYLSRQGVFGLDHVLVTHLDADHVGGMDHVVRAHPELVAAFDHGGAVATTQFEQYRLAAGGRRWPLAVGDRIDLGPSTEISVLHATDGLPSENLNSIVIHVQYGDIGILLGGDCEASCEARFDAPPAQIYKVHHHGSNDSSSAALLDALDPWVGLVSAGAGNPFGHPGADSLARLEERGVIVHRTDLAGDVIVTTDGERIEVDGAPMCRLGATRRCGTTDVGACTYGIQRCLGGAWGPCEGAREGRPEDCGNGRDDDCDGATDESDSECGDLAPVRLVQVAYDTPGSDSVEEFVDIYNPGIAAVDLTGWTLADNARSWPFPAGTLIGPGAYLAIGRDVVGFEDLYGFPPDLGGLDLALGNGGDVVILIDSEGVERDRVSWEGFEAGWDLLAETGDSIERIDHELDTDGPSDWETHSPAEPLGGDGRL